MAQYGDRAGFATSGNAVLDALLHEHPGLRRRVARLAVEAGAVLRRGDERARLLFFPLRGTLSLQPGLPTDARGVADLVGNDDACGLEAWLGIAEGLETIAAPAGAEVACLDVAALAGGRRRLPRIGALLNGLLGYRLRRVHRNAACAVHHDVQQRVCRWLLWNAARSGRVAMSVTHAQLADVLGVRRQSVGLAAVALQRDGCIDGRRGAITLLDPRSVRLRACTCHAALQSAHRRLVAPHLRTS
jgi:CRP-like cAMP-binding protein